jgi:GTP cyclohydrolase IA
MIRKLTHPEVLAFSHNLADKLSDMMEEHIIRIYPIPRGGVPVAYALNGFMDAKIVDAPEKADVFVDDIIDSGATQRRYRENFPAIPFCALIDKLSASPSMREFKDQWIVFPWEETVESSIEENVVRLLEFVGEDVKREGLKDTPRRVASAWREWCSGYLEKPEDVLKTFEDGADGVDEMVVMKDIPFYSHCEHHMAPFFGTCTIGYVPDKKIVGLSKLPRVMDIFAKRLQVQERFTNQIADAIFSHLAPKGVGVLVKARHLCMESRGVDKQNCFTVTSALRGVMLTKPEARAEFLDLAR